MDVFTLFTHQDERRIYGPLDIPEHKADLTYEQYKAIEKIHPRLIPIIRRRAKFGRWI